MKKNERVKEELKVVCICNTFLHPFKKGEIYTANRYYSITTRRKLICNIKYSLPYIAENDFDLRLFGFTYPCKWEAEADFYEKSKNMFNKFSDYFIPLSEYRNNQINEILNDE